MAGIEGVAYKNGRFMPMADTTVHILDTAFTKSDLVFDAVSVWDGSFFRFDDHMARFAASCAHVRMTPPMPDDEVRRIMAQCARVNDQPIGNGAPGLASGQLQDLYWSKRSEGWHATPVASLLEPELPQAADAE